jgi:hypothetical protein
MHLVRIESPLHSSYQAFRCVHAMRNAEFQILYCGKRLASVVKIQQEPHPLKSCHPPDILKG